MTDSLQQHGEIQAESIAAGAVGPKIPELDLTLPRRAFTCPSSDGSTHELSANVVANRSGNLGVIELGGVTVRAYSGRSHGELLDKAGETIATLLFLSKIRSNKGNTTAAADNEQTAKAASPHTLVPAWSGKQRIRFE